MSRDPGLIAASFLWNKARLARVLHKLAKDLLIVKSSLNYSYNLVRLDSVNPVNKAVFVCYSPRPIAGQVTL